MDKVVKILPLQDYHVSLYPENEPEHRNYVRSTVIRLAHKEDVLYINCARKIDKEDWYFGLIEAHQMLNDSPDRAHCMMNSTHFEQDALDELIFRVQSTPSQRETGWLNAILGRMFLGVYRTDTFVNYIKTKILKKINKKRPNFLEEITVQAVELGHSVPSLTDPKLATLSTEGEVEVDATLDYHGGLTIHIQTVFNWSYSSRRKPIRVNLVLAVQLKRLTGRLMFKLKAPPTNRYWLGFHDMPEMEWKTTPVVADKQITLSLVTNAIESRIREVIAETFVLPNMDDTPFWASGGMGGVFERIENTANESSAGEEKVEGLRKRTNGTEDDTSSIKSSGSSSSFFKKLTNYLPNEQSPKKRHIFNSRGEGLLTKKTEVEGNRTEMLNISVQPRLRANSAVDDQPQQETKPPLPPRRNSMPIPFHQEDEESHDLLRPPVPPKNKPPLPPRIRS